MANLDLYRIASATMTTALLWSVGLLAGGEGGFIDQGAASKWVSLALFFGVLVPAVAVLAVSHVEMKKMQADASRERKA